MLRVGIVGLGYWGPNLVRCLSEMDGCTVSYVCDRDPKRLEAINRRFPSVVPTNNLDVLLHSDPVDALVVATPTSTHAEIASQALAAGLHVFVEKPLALSTSECRDLIDLAEQRERVLFVGHVFLHSAPVTKLRELVHSGDLGDIYYISSRRLNLGPVRRDVSALWDLAPHDVSVMLDLLQCSPTEVSCCGESFLRPGNHDVCNLTMRFPEGRMGLAHVSWLDPRKDRVMTVVGSQRMAVFDDVEPLEKIRVYDRGVETAPYTTSFGEFQYSYRYGDTFSPRLEGVEPLSAECADFLACIRDGKSPRTDGANGLEVVAVLEAADASMRAAGACMPMSGSERLETVTGQPVPAVKA